jgi:hypothetical protein
MPSDFFVFRYIWQKSACHKFLSAEDLLTLTREEWMIGLETYLECEGSYFPENSKKHFFVESSIPARRVTEASGYAVRPDKKNGHH